MARVASAGSSTRSGRMAGSSRATKVTADDLAANDPYTALGRFYVDLHVRLHVPNPWGLILTGILGLAMLVAAVSGILMHRHLFRDIFILRGRDRLVGLRDLHSVAGTWTLPHAFVLAFTGAYLSFTIAVALPMLAKIAFKGDVREMVTTLNGLRAVDARPAAIGQSRRHAVRCAQARRRAAADCRVGKPRPRRFAHHDISGAQERRSDGDAPDLQRGDRRTDPGAADHRHEAFARARPCSVSSARFTSAISPDGGRAPCGSRLARPAPTWPGAD